MKFGMLGPLEVWDGDERLNLGGPQQRALLAVLLVNANSVVSADRLIDHLWGERPPDSARRLLKGCIAGLRKALRVGRTDRLLTHPPGYLLEVLPGERDLDRFDELVETAGRLPDDPPVQAAALREALSCWRGPALDGLVPEACRAEAARLDERRLSVLEQRVDLDLRIGRYPELVAELQALVRQHPLRERLWAQLMLALHGANRQSDALAVYRRIRRSLVEQLGVEPSATLRQAHRVVLAGTPEAAARTTARAGASPVPAQLPAVAAGFTGRDAELAELTHLLTASRSAVPILAVLGAPGVGKTELALRWAHAVRDRFPDGQLYVDLRGYDPGPPLAPAVALAGVLAGLGVAEPDHAVEVDERAARFRTAVSGRRVLLVLDNAATVEQIRPLLPGTPSCAVVVTSRNTLPGLVALHGAHRLGLGPLPPEDARTLLRKLIGERADAEPLAAAALAEHCDRLPLALRVAAEYVTGRPAEHLAVLAGELGEHRLEVLEAGGDPRAGVRAAFSWSARRLPPEASRVFRLAARFRSLDAETVAAALGGGACAARRVLELLAAEHLVAPGAAGRYVVSGLLRAYAASLDEPFRPAAHHPPTRLLQGEAPGADAGSPHPRRNHDRDSRSVPA
ncbi:BTAD domain-containing putative transcriptional regulator [Amycolatopsis sp. NPDC021455]|uniref:AfsR/SARP family transcriptional regulator n=1 Tax=Amycolatopsis sp. NPDC021455 TaxID=3154901 RepID=UPI0033D1BCF9